jgi:DegV family protein with EDD domain
LQTKPVRVATDSTADIPDQLADELGIGVIHDYINFGEQSLRDKIDISRPEFYHRLATESQTPTTATPGVGEFEEMYRSLGAPEVPVISMHPPARFSGLYSTAVLAAKTFPEGRVLVIDSGQISMGLGWMAIAAARAAQLNQTAKEICAKINAMQRRVRAFAALDTYEFLRRSGRVSWTKAVVGSLLRVRPLIQVWDGQIIPLDRVRAGRRAVARLVELAEGMAPLESLAVLHTNFPEGADDLRRDVVKLSPEGQVITVDVTPVIGVHVGPKALGLAVVSSEQPSAHT